MALKVAFGILLLAGSVAAAALKFTTPSGWTTLKPSSSMRVAEFALPKVAGDAEDASLVLYFFGGQGGTAQANIDRWISQMQQPGGKSSEALARRQTMNVGGLAISLVDVSGTYTAEMSPGSSDHFNKPNFRLKAAVIETPGGPYFVKLTGPARTIAKWDESFTTFLKSLRWE
jgi:hypothetical protein